jgi:hypothetical protein
MLTVGMRKEPSSASGLTDDSDGELPRAQNTLVCTGTWPLDLDPQAAHHEALTQREAVAIARNHRDTGTQTS